MNKLSTDLRIYPVELLFKKFDRTPDTLARTLRHANCPMPHRDGPWLAGGAIIRALLGEKQSSDLDFFFKNEHAYSTFCNVMHARGLVASHSENIAGTKFKLKPSGIWPFRSPRPDVQAIKLKWFSRPANILEDFDLTCCQFAYDGESIITSELAIDDLIKRQLRINRIQNPASTMHRAMRMSRRGFFFASGSATGFLLGVREMPAEAIAIDYTYDDDKEPF